MNMKCIILAAGLGTRMRPLTERIPKPLVQVQGLALIDWTLDFVEEAGIQVTIINTSYLAHMVEEHVARRSSPHIIISREKEPLETGGGILNALPLLGDMPFLSVNSDAICIKKLLHPILRMQEKWNDEKMDALLLLQPTEKAIGYEGKGDFFLNENSEVVRRAEAKAAPYVFTGVQIIHPRLFDGMKEGKFSMNVLYDKNLSRIHGIINDGNWLHVGDLSGISKAEAFLLSLAKN